MTSIFDIFTNKYDDWYDSERGRSLYESELLCIESLVRETPFSILEVGVGTGRFAMHFPNAIGVDPAVNALKIAKMRGIETVQAYGEKLPFNNETFGCILIIVTLCFVKNLLNVLKEAKRVLRRKGSIIMGLVPKDSPWGNFYERKKAGGHLFYRDARFYAFKDIEVLLQKAGLKVLKMRSTLFQKPDGCYRIEMPVEGYVKGAGFLCIEVKKRGNV